MRIPYHPLTHQSLDLSDEELTKEEADDVAYFFRLLFLRMLRFTGYLLVIVASFLLTFFIFR
ncbi:TPA: hypothetical protein O7139_005467 [Salmonella enterica]|nr:hypothetical protein [Salmonella enterica subsp. enterica serovar Typhimurium]HDC2548704.1 hypothetical protein [Salmonella enterica]HDC2563324.1 hypothetical protein [Salmonella enterica]